MSRESGADSRVVKASWEVEAPEKAVEGNPSLAASHAAPLDDVTLDQHLEKGGEDI